MFFIYVVYITYCSCIKAPGGSAFDQGHWRAVMYSNARHPYSAVLYSVLYCRKRLWTDAGQQALLPVDPAFEIGPTPRQQYLNLSEAPLGYGSRTVVICLLVGFRL
jgi:hypothetical protein